MHTATVHACALMYQPTCRLATVKAAAKRPAVMPMMKAGTTASTWEEKDKPAWG